MKARHEELYPMAEYEAKTKKSLWKYLVCWGQDKNVVRIVDTETAEIVRSIELESDPIQLSSQFLLADNALIIPTEGKLTCFNYLTGNVYWTSYIDGHFSLCVSDDESKLVILL